MATIVNAKLVFTSKVDGIAGIYVMDDNGDNRTLLIDGLYPALPRWSPDGKQIVFHRDVKNNDPSQRAHLFLMNSDGTNVRQLTPPPLDGSDIQASFSPDGKSVIFSRYERNDNGDKHSINVVDIASGQVNQIVDLMAQSPFFSPNGKEILCSSIGNVLEGGGTNFYIMNSDGKNVRTLLNPAAQNNDLSVSRDLARWSPDGKHILYTEFHLSIKMIENVIHWIPKGYFYTICNRKGQTVKRLKIPNNLRATGIDWMDNGKAIAFCAYEVKLEEVVLGIDDLPWHIYKYNILSEDITRLTDHHAQNFRIDWISDDVLSVSAHGKKKGTWGKLKQASSE